MQISSSRISMAFLSQETAHDTQAPVVVAFMPNIISLTALHSENIGIVKRVEIEIKCKFLEWGRSKSILSR